MGRSIGWRLTIRSSRRRFAARLNSGVGPRGQTFVAVWVSEAVTSRGKRRVLALCAALSFPIARGASRCLAEASAAMSFPHGRGASLQSRRLGVQFRQVGRRHHYRRPNNSFKPNLSAARPSRLNSGVRALGLSIRVCVGLGGGDFPAQACSTSTLRSNFIPDRSWRKPLADGLARRNVVPAGLRGKLPLALWLS